MKFVIYAESFDERSGGTIVLHQLCNLLNKNNQTAYIAKAYQVISRKKNTPRYFWRLFKRVIKNLFFYKFNPNFSTPLISTRLLDDDFIAIYPAATSGNPLKTKKVIRWFLHKPGNFTNEINYGNNELYFYYANHFNDPKINPNLDHHLTLVWNNYETFKKINHGKRSGTCYMLRKGKGRKIVHNLENSILLDGRSNKEISRIMNQCEYFISYDLYTMYSRYAVICGCKSIVVPDEKLSEEDWRPEKELRYGIAYGFENLEKAENTTSDLFNYLEFQESEMQNQLEKFIKITENYFKK